MTRVLPAVPRRAAGFTLVELLVVMGIIGLLVSLLLPAVTAAIVSVRAAMSRNAINEVSAAVEAFKADWREYPPSSGNPKGSEALRHYLMGTDSKGWGRDAGNKSPYGGDCTGQFGPYLKPEMGSLTGSSIVDGFKPPKAIFYYRFDAGKLDCLDVNDNSLDSTGPPDSGFASRDQFRLLVYVKDMTGRNRWVREDYVLISPGADRFYGHVKETPTGVQAAGASDLSTAVCDDICNFR